MKILICDDEASYGKWLGQQISAYEDAHREPCEVVVSCDCRKLYEEIEKYRGFDVAFFDIEMPGVCHSSSKEEQRAPSTSGGFMLAAKCRWLCPGCGLCSYLLMRSWSFLHLHIVLFIFCENQKRQRSFRKFWTGFAQTFGSKKVLI